MIIKMQDDMEYPWRYCYAWVHYLSELLNEEDFEPVLENLRAMPRGHLEKKGIRDACLLSEKYKGEYTAWKTLRRIKGFEVHSREELDRIYRDACS